MFLSEPPCPVLQILGGLLGYLQMDNALAAGETPLLQEVALFKVFPLATTRPFATLTLAFAAMHDSSLQGSPCKCEDGQCQM